MSFMKGAYKLSGVICCLFLAACNPAEKEDSAGSEKPVAVERKEIPVLEYSVTASFPHDSMSFTEGLTVYNDQLFESTGSPAGSLFRSVVGPVDLKTGKISVKAELDQKYFGEGIVFFKNKMYQLTYTTQVGFMYDAKTFKKVGQFSFANKEGWGMTTDGSYIIMSDGTENLSYYDSDFKFIKTLSVKENGYAQELLNELEYINGFIYANIYTTDDIVKIDPATGEVVAKINLRPLSYSVRNLHPTALEMNGIAYDATKDKIYVTGKAWPIMYEVNFQH